MLLQFSQLDRLRFSFGNGPGSNKVLGGRITPLDAMHWQAEPAPISIGCVPPRK